MTDTLSSSDRKKTMRAVKASGTSLERIIWSMLAGMGINGWKKNDKSLPGKPDIVFYEEKIVIFIDGCFWHACPICDKPLPQSNSKYWKAKIEKNRIRDIENTKKLKQLGWTVIRIWEHEINKKENYDYVHNKLATLIE